MFKNRWYNLLLDPAAGGTGGGGGTPDGGSITPEAMRAAIEKARLEERTHLRGEIDNAKAKLTEAQTQLAAATTKTTALEGELTALRTELETLKKSIKAENGGNTVDVEALITRTAEASKAALQPRIDELSNQLAAERSTRERLEHEARLKAAVTQAAAENKVPAEVLIELVRGASPDKMQEEIASKVALLKSTLPAGGATAPAGGNPLGSLPPSPAGGSANPAGSDPGSNVREMSDDDWRKNRKAILAKASARYGKATLTGA